MTAIEGHATIRPPEFINSLLVGMSILNRDFSWDDRPDRTSKQAAYRGFPTEQAGTGSNTLEETLVEMNTLIKERELPLLPIDYSKPYWLKEGKYVASAVFSTLINYADAHTLALRRDMAPPSEDINKFRSEVHEKSAKKNEPLKISDLIEVGLDIADNNIVGASHLAFFASRISARDLEKRLLPDVSVTEEDMRRWNKDIAQFQVFNNQADGPGDLYYFFTHFFGAILLESVGGIESKFYKAILKRGTPTMTGARKYIAGRPTVTPHAEASMLGRELGLGYAKVIGVNGKPIFSINE